MATIITSIFYITILFNREQHNVVSCRDGRHYLEQVTITKAYKNHFIAKDKTDGKLLLCNYTR